MDLIMDVDRKWIRDLEHVFRYGNRVSPRGMLCFESLGFQSLVDMNDPIIRNPLRKLGYKFMAAEAAWILEGRDDVESISKYSKDISKFSDDGETFFGAYGPKLAQQRNMVMTTLINDQDSRQAVANIWRENPTPTKDVPCTLSLQWLIRHSVLHCVATMRSSDLWLGHPYDVFNFSAYSFGLMLDLNNVFEDQGRAPVILGNLYLTAGSKHIYERNAADVGMIIEDFHNKGIAPFRRDTCFNPEHYDDSNEFAQVLWDAANTDMGARTLIGS